MKFYVVRAINEVGLPEYSAGGDMTTEDVNQAALFRVLICAQSDSENQTFHHCETGLKFGVAKVRLDENGEIVHD